MDSVKFYGTATIGTKGQIVIPTEARKELNLHEGDKVIVVRAPYSGGLDLIKSDALEPLIEKMQARSNKFIEAAQSIKQLADSENQK